MSKTSAPSCELDCADHSAVTARPRATGPPPLVILFFISLGSRVDTLIAWFIRLPRARERIPVSINGA